MPQGRRVRPGSRGRLAPRARRRWPPSRRRPPAAREAPDARPPLSRLSEKWSATIGTTGGAWPTTAASHRINAQRTSRPRIADLEQWAEDRRERVTVLAKRAADAPPTAADMARALERLPLFPNGWATYRSQNFGRCSTA